MSELDFDRFISFELSVLASPGIGCQTWLHCEQRVLRPANEVAGPISY